MGMTVDATLRRAGPLNGNGVTTSWPFAFKVFAATDVQVLVVDVNGLTLPAVLNTDFSVTLNPDQTVNPGGSVTYPLVGSPLATGGTVTITGALPYNQTLSLPGGGNFSPRAIENQLDRLAIQSQQLAELQGRSFTFPANEGAIPAFPPIAERANKLLGFDSNGNFIGVLPQAGDATTLAMDLANTVLPTKGPALVGHNQALNYVTATIGAHASLMEVRDVTQFPWLADKTGATDAGPAINAAIIASNGRWKVFVPPGNYLLTTPIQLNEQTGLSIVRPAVWFEGAGINKTFFDNRTGDYGIKHTVTLAQSNAQAKAYNGFIGGFSMTVAGGAPAGSAGIRLESFWMGKLDNIYVAQPKGHGLAVMTNGALNPNSDYYSCGDLEISRFACSSASGLGIFHNTPGTTLRVHGHYITNCAQGGIQTCGANGAIENGALAGNLLFGLKLAFTTTTPHNILVRGNEIDNNAGRQVIIEGYNNYVTQNRFIQTEGYSTPGAFPATDQVYIDSAASGGAQRNVISNNLSDIRNRVSASINGVTTTDTAGTTGNRVVDMVFSATAGVTKYNFLGTGRVRNVAVENGVIVANSTQGPVGDRVVAVVAVSGGQTLTTTAVQKIAFGAERSDENNAWDTTNNRFTVPHQGIIRISGSIPAVPTPAGAANVAFQIHIYKNGALEHTFEFPRGLAALGTVECLQINTTLRAAAGDYYEIFGQCGTANRINFSSSNTATLSFEMV